MSSSSWIDGIVRRFLDSHLSLVLLILSIGIGLTALGTTPREEDPQIVVPLADVHVQAPGMSADEIERLVATPLETILYQIDGVEYVYSRSSFGNAVVTVRFYVGEDRERSLVKLFKRIAEHEQQAPPGVTGWVVAPVEIDDVPIVTLTLHSSNTTPHLLRRVGEELAERLAAVEDVSRVSVVGGPRRRVRVLLDPEGLAAHSLSTLDVARALEAANVRIETGAFRRDDRTTRVEAGAEFRSATELPPLVVGVQDGRPVYLRDVANVIDGPEELESYVRHGKGPAMRATPAEPEPAVTIALAKKRGTNAVRVAERVLDEAERLRAEILPANVELTVTRDFGHTANEKVDELLEALLVAVGIVIALLTLGLGGRQAVVVAVAVPVVFGLTLGVNQLLGFTINRVTLFALILSLGLLVDDPIVDVENITRHFALRGRASKEIVREAVAEIRPPLIVATLAVIVSFLPMFFITGMMGPYMRPMALNVPIAMLMSMLVAFTITPWLSWHLLRGKAGEKNSSAHDDELGPEAVKQTRLYRWFRPLMAPLLARRSRCLGFLALMAVATLAATLLAATRNVPLKMLPFDNKNDLQILLDFAEGTTLERSDAAVMDVERFLATVPEVRDTTSYVGLASPMDFNGLVRHHYLRRGDAVAEVRVQLADKDHRAQQSHALGLRLRPALTEIAERHGAVLQIIELPPGPPVLATVVAEIRGRVDHDYDELIAAARRVRQRLQREPGVVDVDDSVPAATARWRFEPDREKAALHGVTVEQITRSLALALGGEQVGLVHAEREREPLALVLQLERARRSSTADLAALTVRGTNGNLVPLAELGRFLEDVEAPTIDHKNLERVVYVFAEVVGRAPAEVVLDVQADRVVATAEQPDGFVDGGAGREVEGRTYLSNGGGLPWAVADGIDVDFAGEGEWKITLDVFRDLGLAFAAALVGIYVLLLAQTGSFVLPVVVMLAIPLTVLGIMPGFWLLDVFANDPVHGVPDPVFFTATGMIGMIALAGIVTRDAIILVDFLQLARRRGRTLFEALLESRVVRLRPILLTSATAMLSAAPITVDPIFSGLAWALIFGLFASTVFTLFVIPLVYWLLEAKASDWAEARRG